jgi:sugar O-acyltransferase (sialic acid O-acetyltransferase NeuD family)
MLIAGAGRHAKGILEIFHQKGCLDSLFFFDDISTGRGDYLFGKFPVIKTLEAARLLFSRNPEFVLGLGNPHSREKLAMKLIQQGGRLMTIISSTACIGHYEVQLGNGTSVMQNVLIGNCVSVGEGTLINAYSSVHHDVVIGIYCEISPHAVLLGGCSLGDHCFVGCNANILPDIKVGRNVIIGAGAVVDADLPDNCVAAGMPAKIIRVQG